MEVLKEDDSDELLNEELVLPWHTNLAEKTRADFFHDSRWFLEFAGFLDPSKVNHKPGNRAPEVKAVQHAATEAAFTEFLKQAHDRPRWATLQLLRFARQTKERVDKDELGPMEVRQRLAPFKKAFDVNGIAESPGRRSQPSSRGTRGAPTASTGWTSCSSCAQRERCTFASPCS